MSLIAFNMSIVAFNWFVLAIVSGVSAGWFYWEWVKMGQVSNRSIQNNLVQNSAGTIWADPHDPLIKPSGTDAWEREQKEALSRVKNPEAGLF